MTEYPQNMLRCGPMAGTSSHSSRDLSWIMSLRTPPLRTQLQGTWFTRTTSSSKPPLRGCRLCPGITGERDFGNKKARAFGVQDSYPPQRKVQKTPRGPDVAARLHGARRAPLLTTDRQMSAAWWRISTATTPHQEVELQRLFSKPLPWNIVEDVRSSTSGALGALRAEGGRQPLQCRPFLSPFSLKQRTWVSPWNPLMPKRPHRLDQRRYVMTFFSVPPKRPR